MMSSKSRRDVTAIVDEVFELLSEKRLSATIDKPIEKAAASFQLDIKTPVTHDYFIATTSRFVRHVYQEGLPIRQKLSPPQDRFEAMALLESGYQNAYGKGYNAAYLDAQTDILPVLIQISEHLKMISRAIYGRWVCATRIGPTDWSTKCQIAEILVNRFATLPPTLANCPPAQLADHIHQIITVMISSEQTVYSLLSAGMPDNFA